MNESLKSYADVLVRSGLAVYYPEKPTTYFWFSDGINIGYVQIETAGFSFSTVHLPNKESGTGFESSKEVFPAIVQDALKAFHTPRWASQMPCVKYRDWGQFESGCWQKLVKHSI